MACTKSKTKSFIYFILAVVAITPFCYKKISETDAGWHLALGRLIWESRSIPFSNALSWTNPEYPWYPTSWLFDLISFKSFQSLGPFGLQSITLAFAAIALLGIALTAKETLASDNSFAAIALLSSFLLIPRITTRPHIATWCVLAFTLWLCIKAAREKNWRLRIIVVPSIALGSNLHSGAAFASIAFLFFCLEAYRVEGRHKRELVLIVAGFAAALANPGGLFNLRYLISHLSVQDVVPLKEFLPPSFFARTAFFLFVPMSIAGALWARNWPLSLCSIFFGAGGLRTDRLVFDFFVIAAPCLCLFVKHVAQFESENKSGRLASTGSKLVITIACLIAWQPSEYLSGIRLGPSFDERYLPLRAVEFAKEHGLRGRIFNGFSDGGYISWSMRDTPVFQDGRVQAYPAQFFQDERSAEKSPLVFQKYLIESGVEWAITTRIKEALGGYRLVDGKEWALVYWDGVSEIYVRRDIDRFARVINEFEYRYFKPYGHIVAGIAHVSKHLIASYRSEVLRFRKTSPEDPISAVVLCGLAIRDGFGVANTECERAKDMADSDFHFKILAAALKIPAAAE